MNLLEMILNPQNKELILQAGQRFGMGEDDARNAIGQIVPAISRGLGEPDLRCVAHGGFHFVLLPADSLCDSAIHPEGRFRQVVYEKM